MATLFFWAVLGALAGAFAKLVLWDDRRENAVVTMLLGIGGGLAGGFVRVWMAGADSAGTIPHGFDGVSMLLSIVGAAVLLIGYYALVERRSGVQVRTRRMAA